MKRITLTEQHHQIARLILATWRPRMDVWARRIDDPEELGRLNDWAKKKNAPLYRIGDYRPERKAGKSLPLTDDVVAAHVAGAHTIGFYPLHPDGTTGSVSVDFDNHRGTRIVDVDPREELDRVTAVLLRRGIRHLANVSRGGAGYWLHLFPPVGTSARVARAALHAVLNEAGVKHLDRGGTFDALCPKQDELFVRDGADPTRSPGNLFCVPCCGRWLSSQTPGTHFIGTDPLNLNEQATTLQEYV